MRIVEGVIGCQSSVGHLSIGRLWEYDFLTSQGKNIALFLYTAPPSARKPIAYLYNSQVLIQIADNNNLYQRWKMMTGRLKTIIIKQMRTFYGYIFELRRKSSEIRRRILCYTLQTMITL